MVSTGVLVLSFLLFVTCSGQDETTTHVHYSTREHQEYAQMQFFFDDRSNYLILKKDGYCYFYHLSVSEETIIHKTDGLRNIELQMLHMTSSSTHLAMRGGDHAQVSNYVYTHLCAKEHLIKLVLVE